MGGLDHGIMPRSVGALEHWGGRAMGRKGGGVVWGRWTVGAGVVVVVNTLLSWMNLSFESSPRRIATEGVMGGGAPAGPADMATACTL